MTTMHYLQGSEGKVAKKFVVRATNSDELLSSCSKIRDNTSKFGGTMLFERKLSETCYFMITIFNDTVFMYAWESMLTGQVEMADIVSCKVLIITNDEGNNEAVEEQCVKVKNEVFRYKGAVLSQTKVANGEYRLILFFTDKEQMLTCEKLLGITGA